MYISEKRQNASGVVTDKKKKIKSRKVKKKNKTGKSLGPQTQTGFKYGLLWGPF